MLLICCNHLLRSAPFSLLNELHGSIIAYRHPVDNSFIADHTAGMTLSGIIYCQSLRFVAHKCYTLLNVCRPFHGAWNRAVKTRRVSRWVNRSYRHTRRVQRRMQSNQRCSESRVDAQCSSTQQAMYVGGSSAWLALSCQLMFHTTTRRILTEKLRIKILLQLLQRSIQIVQMNLLTGSVQRALRLWPQLSKK